ncbi:DUF2256 domain-containing protein [Pseudomonadales bacterium]|nr:DUF2256 domain-containing protein [Pseudomonadales bacterium]
MTHQKRHLPTKICVHCGLVFAWRKKWRKDWEKVQYCSERCRRNKSKPESESTGARLDKDLLR